MDVSKNNGTPKSSILIGFSFINHPFWGAPILGNPPHIYFFLFSRHSNHILESCFPSPSGDTEPTAAEVLYELTALKLPFYVGGSPGMCRLSPLKSSRICFFELESIAIRAPKILRDAPLKESHANEEQFWIFMNEALEEFSSNSWQLYPCDIEDGGECFS